MNIGSESLMQEMLDEKLIGYKVVARKNGKCFEPATDGALQRIAYRLNQETRQKVDEFGPFAIFDTLERAEGFAQRFGGHILLVEYEPSVEDGLWKKNPPSFVKSGRSYYAKSNGCTTRTLDSCPEGTILCKSVYVLEIIK